MWGDFFVFSQTYSTNIYYDIILTTFKSSFLFAILKCKSYKIDKYDYKETLYISILLIKNKKEGVYEEFKRI